MSPKLLGKIMYFLQRYSKICVIIRKDRLVMHKEYIYILPYSKGKPIFSYSKSQVIIAIIHSLRQHSVHLATIPKPNTIESSGDPFVQPGNDLWFHWQGESIR